MAFTNAVVCLVGPAGRAEALATMDATSEGVADPGAGRAAIMGGGAPGNGIGMPAPPA